MDIDAEIAQAGAEEATAATKKQLEDYQSLLNDQVSFSAKIYQEEADAKQKSLEDMAEDTRRYLEDIAEQWSAMKMETFYDFFGESAYYDDRLAEMVTRFRESYDEIYNFTVEAAQAMKQAFSDFFFDLMTGEMKSWKDYVGSFLRSLGRMVADWVAEQIKLLLQMAIAWAVSKAASGAAGGGGGVGAAHSGGMVKRLHWGGLASNEVPAILQSGEYVVNKQAARRNLGALEQMNRGGDPGGQQVTVINIQAVDTQSFFDACQRNPGAVLAPISASLKNSGSLRYEIMEATQ